MPGGACPFERALLVCECSYPYTYTDLQRYLHSIDTMKLPFYKREVFCFCIHVRGPPCPHHGAVVSVSLRLPVSIAAVPQAQ